MSSDPFAGLGGLGGAPQNNNFGGLLQQQKRPSALQQTSGFNNMLGSSVQAVSPGALKCAQIPTFLQKKFSFNGNLFLRF